jgi:hypothetical protein
MIDSNEKRQIGRTLEALKKNPPVVTEADMAEGRRLLGEHKKNEDRKDRDIKTEIGAVAHDVSGYIRNQLSGIGQLFNGFGEGKIREVKCHFCGEHCSGEWHFVDGNWYGKEHKQFASLSDAEQEKERESCLKTNQKKR